MLFNLISFNDNFRLAYNYMLIKWHLKYFMSSTKYFNIFFKSNIK